MARYQSLILTVLALAVGCGHSEAPQNERTQPLLAIPETRRATVEEQHADAQVLFEKGEAEFQQGKFDASAKTFTRCIDVARRSGVELNFSVYGLLGLSHYKTNEFQKALDATTAALKAAELEQESDDIMARLFYQRAMIYLELQDEELANSDFSKAREYDSESSLAPQNN